MPADIYNSAVVIEAEGVDARVLLHGDDGRVSQAARGKGKEQSKQSGDQSTMRKTNERKGQSLPRNIAEQDLEDEDDYMPTRQDLAKSFLAEEPLEERKRLEAALGSQSQYLQESGMYGNDEEEDENQLGTGTGLSLPGFLANFLKGITDRLEITVNNINIQVDANVALYSGLSTTAGDCMPSVSIKLHAESLAMEGLTSRVPPPNPPVGTAQPSISTGQARPGKRRMSFQNLCASLILDPALFASFSAASGPSSPLDARSEFSSSDPGQPPASALNKSIGNVGSLSRSSAHHSTHSVNPALGLLPENPRDSGSLRRSHDFPPGAEDLSITDVGDRFADVGGDGAALQRDTWRTRSRSTSSSSSSGLSVDEEEFCRNGFGNREGYEREREPTLRETANGKGLDAHLRASRGIQRRPFRRESDVARTRLDSPPPRHEALRRLSVSQPNLTRESPMTDERSLSSDNPTVDVPSNVARTASDGSRSSGSDTGESSQAEDLSESKVFSHEEAESMYMSALSDAQSHSSLDHNLPGSWKSIESSSGESKRGLWSVASALFGHGEVTAGHESRSETPKPRDHTKSETTTSEHASLVEENRAAATTDVSRLPEQGRTSTRVSVTDNPCVARRLLFINEVSLWFPGDSDIQPPSSADASGHAVDTSVHQGLPGSFSQYAESSASRRLRSSSAYEVTRRPSSSGRRRESSVAESVMPDTNIKNGLDVVVDRAEARVDVSNGRLLIHLLQQLLNVWDNGAVQSDNKSVEPAAEGGADREHKVTINYLSIKLVERLATVMMSDVDSNFMLPQLDADVGDVILKTDIDGLTASVTSGATSMSTTLNVDRFTFGLNDHNILSFDAEARMRTSVRDVREAQQKDVSLSYHQSSGRADVTLTTLPLRISLDIQKLDETLSSFGGLSGVMELGSSIASNSTLLATSPKPQQQPRVVHFERPPEVPPAGGRSQVRFNARLGGILLTLKGKSCGISLHSSAIKIVAREKAVAVQIDEAKLRGPIIYSYTGNPPLVVGLDNARLDYLYTPEETDLTRLVSLICPSKDKYEDDDDILLDTLLRQRKKGSLIRLGVSGVRFDVFDPEGIEPFHCLSEEMAKLATVAKYLPEDDRPGILILASVKHFDLRAIVSERIGTVQLACQDSQIAYVGLPSLVAFEVGRLSASRNKGEELVSEVLQLPPHDQLPMVMARMIGDEMEPTVKIKLFNVCVEYRVPTIMALLGLSDGASTDDLASGLASSVTTITGYSPLGSLSRPSSGNGDAVQPCKRPLNIDLLLRDCALGLNPRKLPSKGLFLFSNTRLTGIIPVKFEDEMRASLELRKASLLLINDAVNDVTSQGPGSRPVPAGLGNRHVAGISQQGYVAVCTISAAKASVETVGDKASAHKTVKVDFTDALFVLETCADSTQTLIGLLNGLTPPKPPNKAVQYRTKPVPIQNMMASFSGEAYEQEGSTATSLSMDEADPMDDELPTNFDFVGSFYDPRLSSAAGEDPNAALDQDLDDLTSPPAIRQLGEHALVESFEERYEVASGSEQLDFDDDYFALDPEMKRTAHKWDSVKNRYDVNTNLYAQDFPLKIRVRDIHVIWNLFDGYDWPGTRETIAGAVKVVEAKAEERRRARRRSLNDEDDEASAVGDFLFNSIWIEIPANRDPQELHRQINRNMDELVSETGSCTGTTMTPSPSRGGSNPRPRARRSKGLRLDRSKRHKITFELKGAAADFVVLGPEGGETQSSLDIRVQDFEIFDHIPTSTWKKFLTHMHDARERELDRPMIRLEIMNVKPVPDLTASEIVLKVSLSTEHTLA